MFYFRLFIYLKFIFIFLFVSSATLEGQSGFRGAIFTGMTAGQIDGDTLVGFKKLGLTTGVKVSFDLKEKLEGTVELAYSQRGSRNQFFGGGDEAKYVKLNYFELPVYVSIRDWYVEEDDYYRILGQVGLSYAALIGGSVQNLDHDPGEFRGSDLSWIAGASYRFSEKIGFTARYTRSFTNFLKDEDLFTGGLLSYFWTFRLEFNL